MVAKCTGNIRVVDVDRLALLDVVATGYAVVGVEEAGVDAGDDVLAFAAPAVADVGQGLAYVLAVIAVAVAVWIWNALVCKCCGELD